MFIGSVKVNQWHNELIKLSMKNKVMGTPVKSGVLTALDRNLASKLQKLPNVVIFYNAIRETDI